MLNELVNFFPPLQANQPIPEAAVVQAIQEAGPASSEAPRSQPTAQQTRYTPAFQNPLCVFTSLNKNAHICMFVSAPALQKGGERRVCYEERILGSAQGTYPEAERS